MSSEEILNVITSFERNRAEMKSGKYLREDLFETVSLYFLLPLFFTAFYGMNIDMPFMHTNFAYTVVIIIIISWIIFVAHMQNNWTS